MKLTVFQLLKMKQLIDIALHNAYDKREFALTALDSAMIMQIMEEK